MAQPIVHKTATGKQSDSLSYVLSDATRDHFGDIIEPDGWELDGFRGNPITLFNHDKNAPIGKWSNIRVEHGQLIAEFEPAAPGTSRVADEARRLIEQDILRATSVGFRPVESEPIDTKAPHRGTRYIRQVLLETSIVSVPANPAALQIAKDLNLSSKTMSLAFGESAATRREGMTPIGESAVSKPLVRGTPMSRISQLVIETQQALNTARDQAADFADEDDLDPIQAEALAQEVTGLEKRLASYEQLERATAPRGPAPETAITAPSIRKPLGVKLKEPRKAEHLIRAAVCHYVAGVTGKDPMVIANDRYRDDEATEIITRAAMTGGTTTVAGWAAELIDEVIGDFLATLVPMSVFPQLAAMGTALTFGPGRATIRLPSRQATPSISGSFISEGSPIPVRRLGLTSIQLVPHKLGVISVFSRELARYSNPQIENLLRTEILNDTAITVDTLLLDAVASSSARPAGLTNGVAGLTASALTGYKAIIADINTLATPFDTANAGRSLGLLMNTAQGRLLAMNPGPDGTFGWAANIMGNIRPIISTTIPAGHVYMIDAAEFCAVNGAPEFEVSEQAVLHMEDTTPLQIATGAQGSGVLATPTQSMFQTAQVALRLLMDTTWGMRRAGMIQHIVAVNWVPT